MISSIFGKTKPINYVILLVFLVLLYGFVHFFQFSNDILEVSYGLKITTIAVLIVTIFLVNFILHRNKITGTNSFGILFYTLLIAIFPEVLMDWQGIICAFFLLLSFRRLVSLKSLKQIRSKIFDATIWILVASFFYDWALLYLIMVFVSIAQYESKNIRSWLVPLAAFFTIFVIAFCVLLLNNNLTFFKEHYQFSLEFDVIFLSKWTYSLKLGVFLLLTLLTMFFAFIQLGKSVLGRIVTLRLIALYFTLGTAITLVKTTTDTFPIIITFFATVVFLTSYIENIKKPKLKEAFLTASIILPLIGLIINVATK